MKFFIAIFLYACVIALALAEGFREALEKYKDKCGKEMNISASDLEKFTSVPNISGSSLGRCYAKCILVKLQVFNDKNGFDVPTIFEKIIVYKPPYSAEELRKKLDECAKEADKLENVCDKAYQGLVCFKENI